MLIFQEPFQELFVNSLGLDNVWTMTAITAKQNNQM